jgi:hypothetical protein
MRGRNVSKAEVDFWSFPSPGEIDLVRAYQSQLQLLTGWLFLARDRISFEIVAAATLVGMDASCFFHVPNYAESKHCNVQFNRWRVFLEATEMSTAIEKDAETGAYKVDLMSCCEAILRESNKLYFNGLRYLLLVLSLVNAAIPLLFVENFEKLNRWEIVYHLVSFILNIAMYYAVSAFLWVAVLETLRRNAVSHILGDILRTVDIDTTMKVRLNDVNTGTDSRAIYKEKMEVRNVLRRQTTKKQLGQGNGQGGADREDVHDSISVEMSSMTDYGVDNQGLDEGGSESGAVRKVELPQLDLTNANNFVMWMHCRTLLNALGRRPRFRLDIYTGNSSVHGYRVSLMRWC